MLNVSHFSLFFNYNLFVFAQTDEVHAKDNTRPGANSSGKFRTLDLLVE